ncbi:MAG: hypothetical protein HZA52_06155 [Planctomycetes bacterium]|nr:hypothetical protein [Planctomycetota bacterium]
MSLRTIVLCLALGLSACSGTRELADPILEIRTPTGSELGVATDYGIVFLGRTAQMGEIEVIVWYGDGPSVELAVVEPIGQGLFTAEPEIRVPAVPLSFRVPKAGDEVWVKGRRGEDVWDDKTEVVGDARVRGILLAPTSSLAKSADQVGAGVYYVNEDAGTTRLVGLVSGVLELTDADGATQRYLTVVGPDDLWRLATYRRDLPHKPRWIYREDIL